MRTTKIYSEDANRSIRSVITTVPADFVQIYDGAMKYLHGIRSASEVQLAFYLFSEMDSSNIVRIDKEMIMSFARKQGLSDNENTSLRYVRSFIADLIFRRVIIRINSGVYTVNPMIAWKKEAEERKKIIESLISSGHKLNIDEYGDTTGNIG